MPENIGAVLTPAEAAERLRLAKQTLARWRTEGHGPPFLRVGGRIAYLVADLDRWLAERRHRSTAEPDGAA